MTATAGSGCGCSKLPPYSSGAGPLEVAAPSVRQACMASVRAIIATSLTRATACELSGLLNARSSRYLI